jgi:cobalt-zinc-cadmium resistance protein CzcA
VDATVETVKHNLTEGAILVIAVLFLLLGNIRAALLTAFAIPLSMLMTATGMVQSKISGNLMSLGAIDFGLIVDGAVIIVENCLRKLAEKQHELGRKLTTPERLHEVMVASKEMIQPSVFGQAIIITVYLPILALTGVEGKMFKPMALTVIFALVAAFRPLLTVIPALVSILIRGRVKENGKLPDSRVEARVRAAPPILYSIAAGSVVPVAVLAFVGSTLLFLRLGQEFAPTLDEHDIALQAMRIPSTSLTQSTEMQKDLERTFSSFPEGRVHLLQDRDRRGRGRPNAAERLRHVHHLKTRRTGAARLNSDEQIERREKELGQLAAHEEEGHGGHGEEGHGEEPEMKVSGPEGEAPAAHGVGGAALRATTTSGRNRSRCGSTS